MNIVKINSLAEEAFKEIHQYQTGKKKIIKTARPYIDEVGIGLVNGSVVCVAANSGIGKSFELTRLIDNILDVNLNPNADKYISLNVSLEMRMFSLILRGLDTRIKTKEKKDILLEVFTEEEKEIAKKYFESLQDNRRYISQTPTTAQEFYQKCDEFLEEHKNAESVIISIDHVILISGSGKQQVLEDLIEHINNLKMKHKNVIFILLSQTNSENIKRAKDKDRMSQPQPLDLYYSQFTMQVSDYVCVITNPARMGIKEYSKINPERYPNLKHLFLEEDSKGKVSLQTDSAIYYHLLKVREAPIFYTDIFAEMIEVPEEYKEKETPKNVSTPSFTLPPVFENPNVGISPIFDLSKSFDPPNKDVNTDPF